MVLEGGMGVGVVVTWQISINSISNIGSSGNINGNSDTMEPMVIMMVMVGAISSTEEVTIMVAIVYPTSQL